ncbi:MAG: hydroxyphenylacetyl-CoA thioesterase PaaI [bacterium]|nr:hydroxyphenylacetyl-CoA thioesterase PaaI [bacterium]
MDAEPILEAEVLDPEEVGRWIEANDRHARALGIRLEQTDRGRAQASLEITGEMLNAVGLTMGGVTFTLADFAFAVASNSHGTVAVSLSAQIQYCAASRKGDRLTAAAQEMSRGKRTGVYRVEVRNQDGELIALLNGTVQRLRDSLGRMIRGDDAETEDEK